MNGVDAIQTKLRSHKKKDVFHDCEFGRCRRNRLLTQIEKEL